ncbi:MAG: cell surface protein SprA, partial [Bacteroidetes bacterium]|nr:cell surface protein SprA [Bacteroidota bacterium]
VRNPKRGSKTNPTGNADDGISKCAEVWVNELRLADFDEHGGYAGTGHVTTKLADLGTVTLAGNYSSPGWGSIEKKVSERQKETRYQYDISSQIALHKFLPADWGISLPMYVGYSQAIIRPQYNPLDPDIKLYDVLHDQNLPKDYRDKIRRETIDETDRRSINFTNVKKEKSKKSKHSYPIDISNFAFNFSYSQFHNHSATIDFYNMRDYRGGFVYGYAPTVKNIQPFKKSKLLSKKAFALIKDFNFTPIPNKYSFLADATRHYSEKHQRDISGENIPIDTFYEKTFTMLRSYDLKWDLTKSIKLDYHADNTSRILEPRGAVDLKPDKDVMYRNFFKGGNNIIYMQKSKADYTVPINKFPLTDWITANAGYSADYKWMHAPYSADSLGHFLTNGNQKTLNTQANMLTLYNKIPFFKKVNQGIKKKEEKKTPPKPKNPPPKNPQDTLKKNKAALDSLKKKEKKKLGEYLLPQYAARTLMMLKNVSANITDSRGTSIAGFNDSTKFLGMSPRGAPGPGFVFGQQNYSGSFNGKTYHDFGEYAASHGWIVQKNSLNTPYLRNSTTNITGRANIEPAPGFKIELTANRSKSVNHSEFFRWARIDALLTDSGFVHQNPIESGNFSMSFLTWKTAFEKTNKDYSSQAFTDFLANRSLISEHLADHYKNGNSAQTYKDALGDTYHVGYGPTSQATMMFAFLSAYSRKDPSKYPLETFPKIPKPNWRITYDGLSKIKPLKKIFKTVTLSHAYRSSYSFTFANNLKSNLQSEAQAPSVTNVNGDYLFYEQINSVTISEQFAPLIKVDMTLQNGIQINTEIKKDRNIALSFANNQLTEINGKELVVGTGYRWKNLELKNPFGKNKKGIKSDLNLKADFSIRENLTVIRKVVEGVTQPTAGQIILSLKTSADYMITQRITARVFFDKLFTTPKISTSFKSSNTNGGVSIRFSLI